MQSRSIRRSGQPICASASLECGLLTGTRSAEGIMASGHANRANRPNTWLHRPATRREVLTCQPGAVHTWHKADVPLALTNVCFEGKNGHDVGVTRFPTFDPKRTFMLRMSLSSDAVLDIELVKVRP